MNSAIIRYITGWILKLLGCFLTLPLLVSIIYQEERFWAWILVMALSLGAGFFLSLHRPEKMEMYTKEGFFSVSLSWILMSIFGALPFVITGDIPNYVDALFETISGFTTTGASILNDVESLSHSALFWRSFTHWIGGMGVFVFMLAILPMLGGSVMNLMKAESPGPSVDKLVPHVKDTAKILYFIYLALTLIEIVLLLLFGMPLFDSIVTGVGTTGTGGFGIRNDSIAGYSPAVQTIITIFMILSGVNYAAYFLLISRKFREIFRMEEVKWYFAVIFSCAAVIAFNIQSMYDGLGEALRHAFFQVGSIITTTGFCTTDFDQWPQLSKTILITLMFVGACAGSTGGGIKISRFVILFKTIRKELYVIIHPRLVKKIRMDDHPVAHETIRATNVFIAVYCVVLFASLLLISFDEYNFTTNFTAVAATLNNIGPGMDLVGPTMNFSLFSVFSKFVLMFDMLAGRLELFPMLLLLTPAAWKTRSRLRR